MNSKSQPSGTFREVTEEESKEFERILAEARGGGGNFEEREIEYWKNAKPTFSDDLIESYNLFINTIYDPKNVLYTSCELDGSPLRAFPNAKVTFIDKNKKAIDAMKGNEEFQDPRVTLIEGDVKQYQGKRLHDLVILLNPQIKSKVILPYLSDGGYILANDYHYNARQLKNIKSVVSRGTIIPRNDVQHTPTRYTPEITGIGKAADYFWIFQKKIGGIL